MLHDKAMTQPERLQKTAEFTQASFLVMCGLFSSLMIHAYAWTSQGILQYEFSDHQIHAIFIIRIYIYVSVLYGLQVHLESARQIHLKMIH